MSAQWVRDSSLVFQTRDQAFSAVEKQSKEHTYRVMQIDSQPPAYAIERKLPKRDQKYADDEIDSVSLDEDTVFEERSAEKRFTGEETTRDRDALRERDESTDDASSDEDRVDYDYGDEW